MSRTAASLLAAGSGSRLQGTGTDKVLALLGGRPVFSDLLQDLLPLPQHLEQQLRPPLLHVVVLDFRQLRQPTVAVHLLVERSEGGIGGGGGGGHRDHSFDQSPASFVHFSHCSQYALGIEKLPFWNAASGILRMSHLARWLAVLASSTLPRAT